MSRRRRTVTAIVVAALGCILFITAQSTSSAQSGDRYEATIRRTAYGIPHLTAKDFGSLAFGEGYAAAQDHLCSIADAVVLVRGERAKFFGAGDKDVHLNSDISVKALRVAELAANDIKAANDCHGRAALGRHVGAAGRDAGSGTGAQQRLGDRKRAL